MMTETKKRTITIPKPDLDNAEFGALKERFEKAGFTLADKVAADDDQMVTHVFHHFALRFKGKPVVPSTNYIDNTVTFTQEVE